MTYIHAKRKDMYTNVYSPCDYWTTYQDASGPNPLIHAIKTYTTHTSSHIHTMCISNKPRNRTLRTQTPSFVHYPCAQWDASAWNRSLNTSRIPLPRPSRLFFLRFLMLFSVTFVCHACLSAFVHYFYWFILERVQLNTACMCDVSLYMMWIHAICVCVCMYIFNCTNTMMTGCRSLNSQSHMQV